MLDFRIDASRPTTRELGVRLRFAPGELPHQPEGTAPVGAVDLFLPSWTPGSYLIREHARHLSRVVASDPASGRALLCTKISKNRFRITVDDCERIEVHYRVYAHELSVRTADLDSTHAFWNHACVLLWPVGRPAIAATITIDHVADWAVACSLTVDATATATANSDSGGAAGLGSSSRSITLHASDLDDAVDAPVLIGKLHRLEWQTRGTPHAIVLDGLGGIEPPASLVEDLARIVECAAAVFGEAPLPYRSYVFLALFAAEGHGGLEHRNSSTLLMARTALTDERSYRDFLGLAAHELFHAWNVKRMRPVEFWCYDYEQENYTELLWLMEGWTAYYDDLLVVRAGLMTPTEYLATMAKNVQALLGAPGRTRLSLAESSFDAWIRLYRPDENTRNSSQNYYGNGAVAAMCLDLAIRRDTSGAGCLDHVLRRLYQSTFGEGRGYTAADVERMVGEVGGDGAVHHLRSLVHGPLEPDLEELLATVGVLLRRPERDRAYLGIVFRAGTTLVSSVTDGSAAFEAGIAPGDELVAIGGLRVAADSWHAVLAAIAKVGEPVHVLLARRGIMTTVTAIPTQGIGNVQLEIDKDCSAAQLAAREAWLRPTAR